MAFIAVPAPRKNSEMGRGTTIQFFKREDKKKINNKYNNNNNNNNT
jgi:hypothetical protein